MHSLLVKQCTDAERRPHSFKTFLKMANFTSQDIAAIQGVGASVTGLANSISASDTTRKDRDFMREMWDRQKSEWYYQQQYVEDYQKRVTADARRYAEALTAREWDLYNSPSAQIKAMLEAGMNPNAILSKGSSPVTPTQTEANGAQNPAITGSGGASLPGYSPRYYQDPLVMAQVADLSASADLKKSQASLTEHEASYKDSLTALNGSKQVLANLQAEGVPFANRMAEVNARIAEALEGTNVSLGKGELQKLYTQVDLFRRQIQDYDDRHDLQGLRKRELKNQLDIQVASCALLWVREAAARKGIDLTDAQISLVYEQALQAASETDLNEQMLIINSPKERDSSYRGLGSTFYDDVSGPVGSVVKSVIRFFEKSNAERPEISIPTRKANSNLNRVRNKFKGK